ncbi:MAG TPA: MlaD family protein [Solirubrobacteraceae bacterium]|nr:MlaD family protein [Solirubrobacteraceae bacterium]
MRKRGIAPWKAGVLLLVVLVVAVYFGFTKDIPYVNEPYEIKAAFRDTSGMRPGSPVRIAGVEVGEVRKIEHTKPGSRTATVTMAILDKGKPIKDDARAMIRPRIFLEGNFFIDLSPGTPGGEEMTDGDTIPVTRTGNPVQLDQVLKALRTDVREQLKTTFTELGNAQEAGAPQAFNRSLEDQPGAYRWTAVVSEALLGQRPGDLGRVIDDTGDVAAAIDRNPQRLQTLVTDFNRTMAAFAESDGDLRATIRELPDTMREALPALRDLNASFPSVRRLAREIRPGLQSTPETSRALIPLAVQLRGLVGPEELRGLAADLRTSAPPLARLSRDTVPLLEEIRPLASCTSEVLVPFGRLTVPDKAHPASGPVFQEAGKFLPGLAGESRSFDANGQWFKVLGQGGAETLDLGNGLFGTALQPVLGVNPPPDRSIPPYRPDTPCETQELPNLNTIPGVPPRSKQTGSAAADARTQAARAVAMALTQVQNLVSGNPTKVVDQDATAKQVAGK